MGVWEWGGHQGCRRGVKKCSSLFWGKHKENPYFWGEKKNSHTAEKMCLLDGCLQSVLMGISVQQRRKGTIFKASVFKQKKCISMIHGARNELTLKKKSNVDFRSPT